MNAQEWKPCSARRTSVGNASVKDIPMLDVFLQRLDRHSSYNSDHATAAAGGGGGGGRNVQQAVTVATAVANE